MASAESGALDQFSAFLNLLPKPLHSALAAAPLLRDALERDRLVESALSIDRSPLNGRDIQLLTRYAKTVPRAEAGNRALRLSGIGSPSSKWLSAVLLEQIGAYDDAAGVLASIEDSDWEESRALRLLALARTTIRAGRIHDSVPALRGAAQAARMGQTLQAIDSLIQEIGTGADAGRRGKCRIAVLGGGMVDFWAPFLRPVLYGRGVECRVFTGGYDQYRTELLDPPSQLAEFSPDVIVLAVPWCSLGLPDESAEPDEAVRAIIDSLRSLWKIAQDRFGATVIQMNFEIPEIDPLGRLSAVLPGGRARVLSRVNLALWEAGEQSRVLVFDLEQVAATIGKRNWSDPTAWTVAKQYPSSAAAPTMARRLGTLIGTTLGLSSKCLVLDLDNTLWGGVIGEDGLTGIRLGGDAEGEAYTAFQRYLLALRNRGVMLAVCSKNNPDDALSVFRTHPETILKEGDFAIFVANWEPKPANLRQIAASLNVGLDSLVFFDDSPMERNLVRHELPEVLVPELPDNPAEFADVLHRLEAFDALSLTEEDRTRTEKYRENSQRAELSVNLTDLDAYIRSLQMRVSFHAFDEINLQRIVQLLNKTNQFNLTTHRTTAAEVAAWMADPNCYARFMRVRDRFGDNGLTGVLVAFRDAASYRIAVWLMSCRILGRNLDRLMFNGILSFAKRDGAACLIGEYRPTAKNAQVGDLYDRLGFSPLETGSDGARRYRLELATAEVEGTDWCEVEDYAAQPEYSLPIHR
jgi:FkbH-like protein